MLITHIISLGLLALVAIRFVWMTLAGHQFKEAKPLWWVVLALFAGVLLSLYSSGDKPASVMLIFGFSLMQLGEIMITEERANKATKSIKRSQIFPHV